MTTTSPTDAVEFVRGLPDECREAIFLDILKEILSIHDGGALIPIHAGEEYLGTFYPPAAVQYLFDKYGPKLTPEREAEVQHAIDNPGRIFTLEEFWESLREEDAAPTPPAAGREIG